MSTKFSHWTAAITLCTLPVLIWAAASVDTNTDDVRIWLPDKTAERESYERFTELFGVDSEVFFSWKGCSSDDPRLPELVNRLRESNEQTGCFESIVTGDSIIEEIGNRRFSYDDETLREKLTGIFFSETDEASAIVVRLSESGRQNGRKCISEIYRHADATTGLTSDDLILGGDVFTTSQIDGETNRSLLFAFPAILLASLISWICLRNVQLVITTLFVAGYSALLSVALVAALGLKINGMLVIMPILILVLSLSTAIHFCSYYLCAIRSGSENPVQQMLRCGCRPCLMAIITTAIGVAMLATSHVPAVKTFAMCSALGLMLSLISVLIIFPCLLTIWKPDTSSNTKSNPLESPVSNWALAGRRLATPVTVASFLVIPLMLVGVLNLKTTLDPENMFRKDHVVNQHRDWLASRFSQIDAVDLVATFHGDSEECDLLDQIRQVKSMQRSIDRLPEVTSTFSVASVCRLPKRNSRSAKTILKESVINDAIRSERESLQMQRLLAIEPDSVSWRIRVGLNCGGSSHGAVCDKLESVCLEAANVESDNTETWATGIWMMTSAGRSQILSDLAISFMLAFLIITPLVMILLRGFMVGFLAMIPNVLPAIAFFGTIGWMGIEVDIGTLLTASVGLGIAVDDTLHFLHVFRRELKTNDRHTATWNTVGHCWRPMLFTSLICAGGLALFVMSSFIPARQFSIAIVVLLSTAAICDLVVLPALILSPLGRYFEGGTQRTGALPKTKELPAAAPTQRPSFNPLVGYHRHTS